MLRVILEGEDAQHYVEWRKRNAELAKENIDLKAEVKRLKRKIELFKKQSPIKIICNSNGDVLDIEE